LRTFTLSLFALILSVSALSAQTPVAAEPWLAPHFSVDPKALYAAASAPVVSEGTNVAVYVEDYSYSFDEQGRMVYTGHYIYKVLTEKGAEGWDSLSVSWEPWHEARPEIRVRVIAPDFSVHTLDPGAITEAPARGGDYKAYSDGKRLTAPFPAVAPGVVVEEEFVERETQPYFSQGHVGQISFGQEAVPVAHSRAVFDAPSALPLRTDTLLLPNVKPQRTEANGRVTLTYEIGVLDGLDPREGFLPPDVPRMPEIRFSTGPSWAAMAAEYSKIVDSRANPLAVQELVGQLIAGKKSVAEKEAAILDYVDREVRYTGIEFGEAAIMPHDPAESLKQKYGDCKDKATLVVTMLRAAGIPAYVALLNAGARMDVPAGLPGMGLFDHAIVFVPAEAIKGKTPPPGTGLWIDATDRYARLGQLPIQDQGRLALIASPQTTALVKTPESASRDNVLLETREFKLGENGPAAIVEKTQPKGVFESHYRGFYADKPDQETRDNLKGYIKSQYLSDNLLKVERTDPDDLSKPFELTLSCEKAKRGYTDLDSAVAAIRIEGLFARLPDDLKRKDDTEEKNQKEFKDHPRKPRTADWELNEPFVAEWLYRIVPPAGFIPKELPKDASILLGPALLSENFTAGQDGVVTAHLVFDSVKRRYTVAEATELRNKVAELMAGSAILVNFEPKAEALLHEGKVKEALESYRSLVALHPTEAVHHLQVAKVLLEAGMGEAARAEARKAVELDPSSALAEKVLANILKHDLVGRSLRAGSDLSGAAQALREAARLDPDDHTAEGELAVLLEYDAVGRRYSEQAHMKEAIAEYRKLGDDKLAELEIPNNLTFALFYGGQTEEALKAAQKLNPQPIALIGASEAILHGSKAGLAEINKRSNTDAAFKEFAHTAGEMLMNTRHYAEAADLLEAGAAGDNAAQTMGLASMLRTARRHEDVKFANTPVDLVKHAFILTMDPSLTPEKMNALASRNALKAMQNEDPDDLKKELEGGKKLNSQMAREGSSLDVTVDIFLAAIDPKGEGSDETGYREKMQIPGDSTLTFFIVKEGGEYKILDSSEKPNSIALEMLDRIQAGDLKGAKVLLDWLREDSHLEGGDDPLGGPVFPRFWTKGQAADARKMKLAAASLLAGSKPTAAQGVALLEAALKEAAGEREKTNIELALAMGCSILDNYSRLYEIGQELMKQEPESRQAFMDAVQGLMGMKRYDEAIALANQRLKLLDNDVDAQTMMMEAEASRGGFKAAQAAAQKLVDQGKQNAGLLNNIAWYALFTPKVEAADIAAAIKSTEMSKDNPHILHTLACLDAVTGKTKEAHDLLVRSMDDLNMDEPGDDYWYAFGLIAEQYGEREIAIADYRKLKLPKEPLEIPTSSYTLAQARLQALGAEGK
jgi:transglutaminase-like putative cysteine protease/Flp pilus assembly protein TadD